MASRNVARGPSGPREMKNREAKTKAKMAIKAAFTTKTRISKAKPKKRPIKNRTRAPKRGSLKKCN
jgi:hypothetical protein